MTARSLIFASILVSSTPVSSDGMLGPATKQPVKSGKAVRSLSMAIGFEDKQGFNGVALVAQ
jgi:hypothetical protein